MAPAMWGPFGVLNPYTSAKSEAGKKMSGTIGACAGLGALIASTQANAQELAQTGPLATTEIEPAISEFNFHLPSKPPPSTRTAATFALPPIRAAPPALAFTRSRDGALSGASADERVAVRLSSASGAAMFTPGRHAVTGLLSPDVSWSHEVDLTLSMPLSTDSSVSVSAGTLNLRAPSLFSAGRGLGEPTRWMENRVVDVGVKFNLFDDMLNYSGGLSWSNYRMVRATRFTAPDDPLLLGAPRSQPGNSYWHRVDVKLAPGGEGRGVSAYVEIGQPSEDYRSMRRVSISPLLFNGRTFEVGGKVQSGRLKLSVAHSAIAAAYGDTGDTAIRFELNGVQISHAIRGAAYNLRFDDGQVYRSNSRNRSTRLRLSPARLFASSALGSSVPNALTIRSDRSERESDGRNSRRDKLGFSLGWTRDASSTEVGLTRVVRRQRSTTAEIEPGTEYSVDVIHSRTLGPIEVSAYGSVTLDQSAASASNMYGAGLALSTVGGKLPKLSLSLDYNRLDLRDGLDPLFEDRGLSLVLSADLTSNLQRLGLPNAAFLKLKVFGDSRRQRIGLLAADNQIQPRIMLMFGTPF